MDKLIHLILLPGVISIPGSLDENLALKGTAAQSSTISNCLAQRAIDGERYGSMYTYCSAAGSQNPWWRLDLQDYYEISTVIITARSDCCPEQINEAEIRIGNSLDNNGNNNTICAVTSGILLAQTVSYSCHGMEGRYVNVVMTGSSPTLVLCEVEVYGKLPMRKQTFLRLKFSSSGDVAAESNKILHQLRSVLGSNISDFNLTWTQLPKKEEEHAEDGGE